MNYFQARKAEVKETNKAIVTASMMNDLAAHTIMIPGEDGQQIYIRELHTSYMVAGGFATVAGMRTKRLAFNSETVDVTDSESVGRWRELLGGAGVQRASAMTCWSVATRSASFSA